jgi:hypothetical protein
MTKSAGGLHGRRLMEVLARARPASLDRAPAPADAITACLAAAEDAPPARAARLVEGAPVHPGAQMPGPAPHTPDPARRTGLAGRSWPTRRLALTAALSASVAAGLAVTLAVTPVGGTRPPGRNFAPAVTAAAVLNNAALAALREPALKPRPGQFVYYKTYTAFNWPGIIGFWPLPDINTPASCGPGPCDRGSEVRQTVEQWASVSGTRPGLNLVTDAPAGQDSSGPANTVRRVLGRCAHGYYSHPDPWAERDYCNLRVWHGYLPSLPTTAAGMRAYLHRQRLSPGSLLWSSAAVLTRYYLRPAQQAAVYRVLATTPGLTVVPKVTDIIGQVGVGVRYHSAAQHTTWTAIFDPTTFKLLGANVDLPNPPHSSFHGYHGRYRGAVVVAPTIVDKVGQRP